MKALKITGIVAGIVVLALLVMTVAAPSSNHVESTIIINASPVSIFKEANNFKNFIAWSPWSRMDPEAHYSYEGLIEGVGAKMSWEGPEVGKGSQEIIESVEYSRVKNRLVFENYSGTFISEIRLEPVDGGTKVTWTYDSDYSRTEGMSGSMGKVMDMVFMGNMIEDQYKQGLQELKKIVESHPEPF